MDKLDCYQQEMNQEIQKAIDILGAGEQSRNDIKAILERLTHIAFSAGQAQSLSNLITTEDLQSRFGITRRRAIAIAKHRHDKYGIGYQVPGTNQWYFNDADLILLQPNANRPRGKKRKLVTKKLQENVNE